MASASGSQPPALDLDVLIQSLPACKRCRDCRRGCDTLLPKCRQCTKAGVECMFYDHGRNDFLARSYIAELVDHVRRISPRSIQSPATSSQISEDRNPSAYPFKAESSPVDAHPRYEHHFAYASHDYRYLGSESCLLRSPRLQPRQVLSPLVLDDDDDDWNLTWKKSAAKEWELLALYLEIIATKHTGSGNSAGRSRVEAN